MSKEEILTILPNIQSVDYLKIKSDNPYSIMLQYVDAINEKYQEKLSATVIENTITTPSDSSQALICYSFYLSAKIGRGYLYRLFEVEPINKTEYPIKIKVFEKNPQDLCIANTPKDFDDMLLNIFKSEFTSTLILNLIAQIELHNENRNKKD